jgi:hypothetical protein
MNKPVLFLCLTLLVCLAAAIGYGQSTAKMNEVYTRGVAGNLDWIEIYNGAATPLDISGYKIYDNGGQGGTKPKKAIPAGTILPAKGFYVVITDTATSASILDGFGLSSGGETVWFENAGGTIIDSVVIPALGVDTSWARKPDGSTNFVKLSPATRGSNNEPPVVMNEIYSRGVAGNLDWIEIYNGAAAQLDISGYKIYDNGGQGGTKTKKALPSGTVVPSKGFYVVIVDTNTSASIIDGFGLSSGGETVWLENASGFIIDSVVIPALGVDTSWARKPDGSVTFEKLRPVTRGASNGGSTAVDDPVTRVNGFALHQNYPNPFNPTTTISYDVMTASQLSLKVYDLLGREVAILFEGPQTPGRHIVTFDARNLASGVYLCRLSTAMFSTTSRLLLMK